MHPTSIAKVPQVSTDAPISAAADAVNEEEKKQDAFVEQPIA